MQSAVETVGVQESGLDLFLDRLLSRSLGDNGAPFNVDNLDWLVLMDLSDPYPLDLIEAHLIGSSIIQLRGAC